MKRSKIMVFTLFFTLMAAVRALPAAAEPVEALSEESVLQEVEHLRALRDSNPALYREMIEKKKASLKGNLTRLKERNPERAQRFFERQKEMKRRELAYVQQKRPGLYREFSENRKQFWERRARENPQQFRKFMESRPEVRKRWENLRRDDGPKLNGSGRDFRRREMPQGATSQNSGFHERKLPRDGADFKARRGEPAAGSRHMPDGGFRRTEGRGPGGPGHGRRDRN